MGLSINYFVNVINRQPLWYFDKYDRVIASLFLLRNSLSKFGCFVFEHLSEKAALLALSLIIYDFF